jgi:hypothetical protein
VQTNSVVKGTWSHKAAGRGVCNGKMGPTSLVTVMLGPRCPDVEVRGHESGGNAEEAPKRGDHLGDLAI